MQIHLNFEVHDKEPSKTNDHLQENKPRFSEQCKLVYDHMVKYGSITIVDADKMMVKRLASRICDLRKKNEILIDDKFVTLGNTKVKKYWLSHWRFEISSGFDGFRCTKCMTWIYANQERECKCIID
jgi:hypothetical protein